MTDPDNVTPLRPGQDLIPRDVTPSPVATPAPGIPMPWAQPGPEVTTLSVLDLPREGIRGWFRRRRYDLRFRRREAWAHLCKSPDYLITAATYAPAGTRRVLSWWWDWAWYKEQLHLKRRLILDLDEPEHKKDNDKNEAAIMRARQHLRRARMFRFGLTLAFLGALWWGERWSVGRLEGWADGFTPAWQHWPAQAAVWAAYALTGCLLVVVLGRAGSNKGQIVPPLVVPILITEARYTSEDIIRAALAVGFGTLPTTRRAGEFAQVASPGVRADRGGSQFRLILPPGKKDATAFLEVAGVFAANLGADGDMIDAQPVPGRGMDVDIWIADEHRVITPRPSPLVRAEKWCVWDPIPVGTDLRGEERYVYLPWTSTFVSGLSRTGKSFFTRLLAMGVALDPDADLGVWDFKPQGDWRWAKDRARWWSTDASPEGITKFNAHLRWLRMEEMPRRQAVIDQIAETDPARCPEGKLTEAMTRDAALDLGFIVDFIDELQVPLAFGKVGQEIAEHLADLVRRGPAAGIILVGTTQRLDEDSVPKTLRAVFTTKAALRTDDPGSSLLALGKPASSGWDASALPSGEDQKGWVIIVGDGAIGGAMRVRGDLANALDAAEVGERGSRLRAGRRPVQDQPAEPVQDTRPVPPVLAAVLEAWPRPQMACHQDVLAQRLEWEQLALGREMRNVGLPTTTVRMIRPEAEAEGSRATEPGKGYYLADIEAKVRELR